MGGKKKYQSITAASQKMLQFCNTKILCLDKKKKKIINETRL